MHQQVLLCDLKNSQVTRENRSDYMEVIFLLNGVYSLTLNDWFKLMMGNVQMRKFQVERVLMYLINIFEKYKANVSPIVT